MKRLLFFVFGFLAFSIVSAQEKQQANCTQVLRLARAVYEQGRLHELETLLDDCLEGEVGTSNGFATTQEKVDAYRLLCLAYIYLEEPIKADSAMLGLLRTDHFFEVNTTDPAEFHALYNTFRTEPILSFGFRAGGNLMLPGIMKNYYIAEASKGNGKYKPGGNISLGGFVEKEFFPKSRSGFLRNTVLRAEAFYMVRSFKMDFPEVYTNITTGNIAGEVEAKSISQWLDVNFILRYRYNNDSPWDPYFGIGPGVSYLLKYSLNLAKVERLKPDGKTSSAAYSGPSIDASSAFHSLSQSASAVWGINRRFGEFYINLEGRFQFGLYNLVDPKNRTFPESLDYGLTLNDYRQSNVILVAGITMPFFKPKKRQ